MVAKRARARTECAIPFFLHFVFLSVDGRKRDGMMAEKQSVGAEVWW